MARCARDLRAILDYMGRRTPSALRPDEPRWWQPTDRRVEEHGGVDYVVRQVTGARASKVYRCPGCNQEIRAGLPHVVAWPVDGGQGTLDRRHWHTPCWARRAALR